jgi:hypothetical protein
MPGANYVLSKGFLAVAAGTPRAFKMGEVAALSTASTLQPAQVIQATAVTEPLIGVIQEDLDLDKLNTGKAYVGVQIMGIAKCKAGGTITLGARVTTDSNAELIATTTAGQRVVGIALMAAADGDFFDVLLTPGGLVPAP